MDIPFSWIILIGIFLFLSMKILREDERMVVFRLGRYLKIAGPGLVWILPVIDRGFKVNLSRDFPGWQAISKEELEEKIKASISGQSKI